MSTRNPSWILASVALATASSATAALLAAGPATAATPTQCTARHHATVTEADNYSTVCLAAGGSLVVKLHSTGSTHWQSLQVSDDVLRPASTGGRSPVTVTAGSYTAVHAGTADVTSDKPSCPPAPPGGVTCESLELFRISVIVVG